MPGALPAHRTKIVATIGPASRSVEVIERLITAGMSVARLNCSHGTEATHREAIAAIREAERRVGMPVTIMADLPGPKMRLGMLAAEPVELRPDDPLVLTTADAPGDARRIPVSFSRLPGVARPGLRISLADGTIQLVVERVEGTDVHCRVVVGGELRSRKGLNIPGVDLGIDVFTAADRRWLAFALTEGVEAVSQSFVERAADIEAVREEARRLGHQPFVIAKIERRRALDNLDAILEAADGVMIARGDLGVEVPIEEIAIIQKRITRLAARLGRPVITATQMLESMAASRMPTRAEATDVANAILDGTDAVMLSGESATGRFPVESVEMLARIAAATERHLDTERPREAPDLPPGWSPRPADVIAAGIEAMLRHVTPRAVVVPTRSGTTARALARLRLPVWISAVTDNPQTARALAFSRGVSATYRSELPHDWNAYVRALPSLGGQRRGIALLTEGPSALRPEANHTIVLVNLESAAGGL